jgi:hypothetical protein
VAAAAAAPSTATGPASRASNSTVRRDSLLGLVWFICLEFFLSELSELSSISNYTGGYMIVEICTFLCEIGHLNLCNDVYFKTYYATTFSLPLGCRGLVG